MQEYRRFVPSPPPPPKVICRCQICKREITAGEEYYHTPQGDVCDECKIPLLHSWIRRGESE